MILYKFFAIAFLILTPIFAFIIHRFFSLKYLGLNFADLTFPLYFIEVVAVSARFFTHSFLPYITILLSLAAIIITIQMLRKTQSFNNILTQTGRYNVVNFFFTKMLPDKHETITAYFYCKIIHRIKAGHNVQFFCQKKHSLFLLHMQDSVLQS